MEASFHCNKLLYVFNLFIKCFPQGCAFIEIWPNPKNVTCLQPLLVLSHIRGTLSSTLPLLRCSPPSLLLATNHLSLLPCSLKIFGIRCKVFLSNQLFLSNWVTLAWMSLPTPLPQSSLIFPTSKIFIHRLFQQPLSHDIILNLITKNTSAPRILNLNVPISVHKIFSTKICS